MNDRLKSATKPVVNESGIEIKPLYTAKNVEETGGFGFIGEPGQFPFVRGIHPQMYRPQAHPMRPDTILQHTCYSDLAAIDFRFC